VTVTGPVRVETASGLLVGARSSAGEVIEFLGIPYGVAPRGERRFGPADPAAAWSTEREAFGYGNAAIQAPSMLAAFTEPTSEDCLVLNVWAPAAAEKAPVMVWFHGGSFSGGAGSIGWYRGRSLAALGAVVLTVNYRLGPLGYLHLAPFGGERFAGSATAGLSDQALALRWVRDHITAFGGDPDNVTIFGESAGAMSVSLHMGRPDSAGLFHRVIAQSGSALHCSTPEDGEAVAAQVLERLGVDRRRLDALFELPAEAFAEVQADIVPPSSVLALPFAPIVDGHDLPRPPMEAIAAGSASGIDLLCGTNTDEMHLFTLLPLAMGQGRPMSEDGLSRRVERAVAATAEGVGLNGANARGNSPNADDIIARYRSLLPPGADPDHVWSAIGTDLTFRFPMVDFAAAQRPHGPVRTYEFAHRSTGFGGVLGASHSVEIPFVFDNLKAPGADVMLGEMTADRRRLATEISATWVAFANAGDPHASAWPDWPAGHDTAKTMRIDLETRWTAEPSARTRDVWSG